MRPIPRRFRIGRASAVALCGTAVFAVAASVARGVQNTEVRALRMGLQERARSVRLEGPTGGRFQLDLVAEMEGAAALETVGVEVGALQFDVPLVHGRFRGVVDVQGAGARVSVWARGHRVSVRVRGSLSEAPDGALGLQYLRGCGDALFWNGMVYGMHPVTVRLGGASVDGVLCVVGRSAWVPRPRWDFVDTNENDVAAVTLRGEALFPTLPGREPHVLVVPEGRNGRWNGRVRGCALAAGTVPVVSVAGGSGAPRRLDPLNSEALDFGPGQAIAPGIQMLESGGMPVYQVLFDSAIPEAVGPGRLRVVAESLPGVIETRQWAVAGPESVPLKDFDVDVHLLEVREDGTVWGWGGNFDGELGDGTKRVPSGPVPSLLPVRAATVSAGYGFSLAVDEDGRAWQWGTLTFGDIFTRRSVSSKVPVIVKGLAPRMTAVAAGRKHALALDASGRVWAWGDNVYGELGDGTTESRTRPAVVPGLQEVVGIAAGADLSLALDSGGRVWAWGDYLFDSVSGSTVPVLVQGLPAARRISAKGVVLVLAADGAAWAWGPNYHGEVGDGTTERRNVPVQVVGLDRVVSLDAGDFHSVALRDDGTVWTWGDNSEGQLGDGTALDRLVPIQVRDMQGIVGVGAGDFRSVALDADGYLWGWGQLSPLASGVVGLRRGGTGVYPELVRRRWDGNYVKY